MRNTTKLKAILLKYTVSFDMDEEEIFTMTIQDKTLSKGKEFQAKTYSLVISKAYYYMTGELRKEEKNLQRNKRVYDKFDHPAPSPPGEGWDEANKKGEFVVHPKQ